MANTAYIPDTDRDIITGVRQFRLINGIGEIYNCTRPERLLHDPQGLGWGEETETPRLGMTYYVEQKNEIQATPTGDMVFRTYAEYNRFLRFCQVGDLLLCYKPLTVWYYLPVTVRIDKSEIKPDNNHLVCPVRFKGLSYWRERVVRQTKEQGGESENDKTYAYTYSYTYGMGAQNIFEFDLDLDSYFKLTIFGEVTNPAWHLRINGHETASGAIIGTVESANKLVINTDPTEMEIAEYTAAGVYVANRYGDSDFDTARIFALPRGQSTLTVTSDDIELPAVLVEVMKHV